MKKLLIALLTLPWAAHAAIALNPDVTPETLQQTICVPGYTKDVRPATSYTNGIKRKLMREAGIPVEAASQYELDHIVPLALGGHPRSLDNLQLQPWDGDDGARRKDRLEVKLQCLVCSGRLELETAQTAIYEDWQDAFQRYAGEHCNLTNKRRKRPRH